MITTPRPTRQVVHQPTSEVVRRHRVDDELPDDLDISDLMLAGWLGCRTPNGSSGFGPTAGSAKPVPSRLSTGSRPFTGGRLSSGAEPGADRAEQQRQVDDHRGVPPPPSAGVRLRRRGDFGAGGADAVRPVGAALLRGLLAAIGAPLRPGRSRQSEPVTVRAATRSDGPLKVP